MSTFQAGTGGGEFTNGYSLKTIPKTVDHAHFEGEEVYAARTTVYRFWRLQLNFFY
jgi:hypothetical protein